MQIKQFFVWCCKAFFAGILALLIASVVCVFYYNPGTHVTSKTGVTDYNWEANKIQSTMVEGIAFNKTDKNGFINDELAPDVNMDILVMGSSHLEGKHYFIKNSIPYLLSKQTNQSVYNIATSGHTFLTCVKNLKDALKVMQPKCYVIIETSSTTFSDKEIEECLSGKMNNIPSYDNGALYYLQKIPYLKLFYEQIKYMNIGVDIDNDLSQTSVSKISIDAYSNLASKISKICTSHNIQPIVIYHPSLSLNYDGSVNVDSSKESLTVLKTVLESNGIIFVDMSYDFVDMYSEQKLLPHGFCNTKVGYGHLNEYGSKVMADHLTYTIESMKGNR